jgi:hypothetical protein
VTRFISVLRMLPLFAAMALSGRTALIVEVDAGVAASGSSADFNNSSTMSATAHSNGFTSVAPAPLSTCIPCIPNPPFVIGEAQARTNGTLKANAVVVDMDSTGAATAEIHDTITFHSQEPMTIDLDGSLSATEFANAYVSFTVFTPGQDVDTIWFRHEASSGDGATFPGRFTFLFPPFIPGQPFLAFPLGEPLELVFSLHVYANCDNEECFARANFGQTAHIGITGDFVSANGYTYPGLQDTTGVPEPSTGGLAVLGLSAWFGFTRWRRRLRSDFRDLAMHQ